MKPKASGLVLAWVEMPIPLEEVHKFFDGRERAYLSSIQLIRSSKEKGRSSDHFVRRRTFPWEGPTFLYTQGLLPYAS